MTVKETRRAGSKKRKKGSQKGGRPRKRGEAPRKGVDRAFPRNRRVTAEAKRRVAGGEDWGRERFGTVAEDFGCWNWNRPAR